MPDINVYIPMDVVSVWYDLLLDYKMVVTSSDENFSLVDYDKIGTSGGHLHREVLGSTRRVRASGGHLLLEVLGLMRRLGAS